jgi:hypothetical protein
LLLNSGVASGLILFLSRGLRLRRSGVLRRVRVLGLVLLLKEVLLGLVRVLLLDLLGSGLRFRLGRVLGRWVILRVDPGSLVRLGLRRLSGRISLVLLVRLFSLGRGSLLVGRCLSLGVRLGRLRRELLEGFRRTRIFLGLRLAHLKREPQKVRARQRTKPARRGLLVGRWTGILRLIRY